MQHQIEVDGQECILLPRPWLKPAPGEVRAEGAMIVWTCGSHVYIKGCAGQTELAYWHRVASPPATVFSHAVHRALANALRYPCSSTGRARAC